MEMSEALQVRPEKTKLMLYKLSISGMAIKKMGYLKEKQWVCVGKNFQYHNKRYSNRHIYEVSKITAISVYAMRLIKSEITQTGIYAFKLTANMLTNTQYLNENFNGVFHKC